MESSCGTSLLLPSTAGSRDWKGKTSLGSLCVSFFHGCVQEEQGTAPSAQHREAKGQGHLCCPFPLHE